MTEELMKVNMPVIHEYKAKEPLIEKIKKLTPEPLIPTDRFTTILGLIFLAIIIFSLTQFPFEKLLAGDTDVVIKTGYPLSFLELGTNSQKSPFSASNLLIDLTSYLILTYIIDIIIKSMLSIHTFRYREELMKQPKIYENKKLPTQNKV